MFSLMKTAIAPRFNLIKKSISSENTSDESIVIYDNTLIPHQRVDMAMEVPETNNVITEILSGI